MSHLVQVEKSLRHVGISTTVCKHIFVNIIIILGSSSESVRFWLEMHVWADSRAVGGDGQSSGSVTALGDICC